MDDDPFLTLLLLKPSILPFIKLNGFVDVDDDVTSVDDVVVVVSFPSSPDVTNSFNPKVFGWKTF